MARTTEQTLAGMKILLAEDEESIAVPLADDIEAAGGRITVARDGLEAARHLEETVFDVLITDVRMPGMEGTDLLRAVAERQPETAVIVVTGFGTVESAVEAMRLGAHDYILKPFYNEDILLRLAKLRELRALQRENRRLREQLAEIEGLDRIVGKSEPMQQLFKAIRTVARTDANVLITGESGTGKELVSLALHRNSPRREKPFVPLSCAALPATLLEDELFGHEKGSFTDAHRQKIGRFEKAHGGTLFLDDIDDMELPTQVKLLRVLQERVIERLGGEEPIAVDIRVIAATKVVLADKVHEGSFREDLFYRLNVVPLQIPPLRRRTEDIPLLTYHFIEKHGGQGRFEVSDEVLQRMCAYVWPGNVRELENAVQRA
ncbi:MAG: sigma-54-dependent Fis family transcriptional regulator, partial [Planctomycetes bacterium]|nr:sigma-54-dependent Fis family transcriptional regulator [Planctomycetota bacterium]